MSPYYRWKLIQVAFVVLVLPAIYLVLPARLPWWERLLIEAGILFLVPWVMLCVVLVLRAVLPLAATAARQLKRGKPGHTFCKKEDPYSLNQLSYRCANCGMYVPPGARGFMNGNVYCPKCMKSKSRP